MHQHDIHIEAAREHNLKSVTLRVPKHRLVAFTGVSGSGKSSLVFDTIAAEAQRQMNETYSAFVRSSSCLGPAFRTKVSPSSLVNRIFPS